MYAAIDHAGVDRTQVPAVDSLAAGFFFTRRRCLVVQPPLQRTPGRPRQAGVEPFHRHVELEVEAPAMAVGEHRIAATQAVGVLDDIADAHVVEEHVGGSRAVEDRSS